MATLNTNPSTPQTLTTQMLAGVFLYVAGNEDLSVAPCREPDPSARIASEIAPTTEQLAGRYLLVEAVEDLSVHPARPHQNGRRESKSAGTVNQHSPPPRLSPTSSACQTFGPR